MIFQIRKLLVSLAIFAVSGCACVSIALAQEVDLAATATASAVPQRWNMHGQVTGVWQGYGRFRSPYEGDNSLRGGGQSKETVSVTGSLGVLIGPGLEFYLNPEIFQGFGLSQTHGLGGFSNGEAQKGGSAEPKGYIARAFFRKTIGLGGETESVADDFNQLAGTRDVSRLTFTLGRFAVNDIFDQNSYAHDARANFLNYAVWASGAFDYAADQKGYGIGGIVELNQKSWAFRTGFFRQPIHSNAQSLSWDIGRQGQLLSELEFRYALYGRGGIVRMLGWGARSNAGSYSEAVADPIFDPEQSIVNTRRIRTQYGYGVNLEQSITNDLGVFGRWSWRDARADVMSWADMDRSFSLGLSLKGAAWGRPQDTVGVAGAINGLSRDHRLYSAAGGLGVTIGDGRLSYSGETIVETFYSIGLRTNQTLTLDYQYISNPAYNSDRGPISLFAVRAHGQF